ncbi:hypothetical protein PsorP6_015307 [Peronosclerospora sorghi]|uniref:Uncharacterized protein n=1 Tax=Peronosclerospora sorghi TaxID=230839 RepID=A0ACC0VUN6_9STRA|nr:hypothetical protein PsorP6_015307 [Peronosclerospora sorghi]
MRVAAAVVPINADIALIQTRKCSAANVRNNVFRSALSRTRLHSGEHHSFTFFRRSSEDTLSYVNHLTN